MLSALSFLTVIGTGRPPGRHTFAWFPFVGALLGMAVAAAHHLAHQGWSPVVAGGLVVIVDLVLTGALHLDGVADSADGLLPHLPRERRLAVMAEPTVGAFAVTAVVVMVGLRWALLADPDVSFAALAACWAAARTAVSVVPALVPYARPGGLAADLVAGSGRRWAAWLGPIGLLLYRSDGGRGVVALTMLVVGVGAIVVVAHRRLGGFTGDVLGAAIVVGETAALLALTTHIG